MWPEEMDTNQNSIPKNRILNSEKQWKHQQNKKPRMHNLRP